MLTEVNESRGPERAAWRTFGWMRRVREKGNKKRAKWKHLVIKKPRGIRNRTRNRTKQLMSDGVVRETLFRVWY